MVKVSIETLLILSCIPLTGLIGAVYWYKTGAHRSDLTRNRYRKLKHYDQTRP